MEPTKINEPYRIAVLITRCFASNSDWPIIALNQQNAEIQHQRWHKATAATKCDLEDCVCDLDIVDTRILDELVSANPAEDDSKPPGVNPDGSQKN